MGSHVGFTQLTIFDADEFWRLISPELGLARLRIVCESRGMEPPLGQNILQGELDRPHDAIPDDCEVNQRSCRPAHEFGQFA
jgi:hypothetical protein